MNTIIKKDFVEFEKYHKNIYNIFFHILCGFIFMTLLFLLSKNNSNLLLILYSLLILFTINSLFITFTIFSISFIIIHLIKRYTYTISTLNIFLLFLVFYFLPDLSHYLTNELSFIALNINNITPLSLFINVFYLLPFSIMCLFQVNKNFVYAN